MTSKINLLIDTDIGDDEDVSMIGERSFPVAQLLHQIMNDWIEFTSYNVFLHDLLPVCALIHPEWFRLFPRWVEVELKGEKTRGTAVCLPDYYGHKDDRANAKIAAMDHPEKIRKIFLERVIYSNKKEVHS